MVPLLSGQSSGRESQNVAVLEFVWEKLSESSTFVKYAMTRGFEHYEMALIAPGHGIFNHMLTSLDLSRTAFQWLRN